jgi:hypothetical protein
MGLPHERLLVAYLELLGTAIVHARAMAWGGGSLECIADLMDAIHNLPGLLAQWEESDADLLRGSFEIFDKKWVRSPTEFSLCRVLNARIETIFPEVDPMATVNKPSSVPPEVLADLEAVGGRLGIVRDPGLYRRITERAEKARAENDRLLGVQEVGVAIVREIREAG